ncbi:MAG TPA: hypothetical protein DD491_12365 [Halieaceae bacterium]|nr:hypothetical protein [Halieaceae bacterium]
MRQQRSLKTATLLSLALLPGLAQADNVLSRLWDSVRSPFAGETAARPGDDVVCLAGEKYRLSQGGRLVLSEAQLTELYRRQVLLRGDQSLEDGAVALDQEGFQAALASRERVVAALTGPTVDGSNVAAVIPEGSLKRAVMDVMRRVPDLTVIWEGPDFFVDPPRIITATTAEEFLLQAIDGLPLQLEFGAEPDVYIITPLAAQA